MSTYISLSNITSLTAWKNLQTNGAYITTLTIGQHQRPYELHKQHETARNILKQISDK
jgi:hypothetical protein